MVNSVNSVQYTYDLDGNRATLTYPGGTVVEYAYTARNQVASITADGPPPLATFGYDLAGNRLQKTLENGTSAAYQYDDASQLTQIAHTSGVTALATIDYTLNSVGNRTSKTSVGAAVPAAQPLVENYGYDATDQVTGVVYNENANPVRTVDYTYDPVGNRTQVVDNTVTTPYTANNLNQYTAIDSLPAPSYDANGNLSGIRYSVSGLDWAYGYDAQNRFVSASASDNSATATITYDARNRQVSRTINGQTIYFVWDDWNLIEERDSSGTPLAKYIHGPVIDEILAKTDTAGTVYYHHDGLGSTIALTNASGDAVESYSYDVYGTPAVFNSTGTNISVSGFGNRFLFTGREWISGIALYDYRNRVYSAELGRFLQTDPIGFDAEDTNLYRYVENSVILLTDGWGLAAVCGDWRTVRYYDYKHTDVLKKRALSGWKKSGPLRRLGGGGRGQAFIRSYAQDWVRRFENYKVRTTSASADYERTCTCEDGTEYTEQTTATIWFDRQEIHVSFLTVFRQTSCQTSSLYGPAGACEPPAPSESEGS